MFDLALKRISLVVTSAAVLTLSACSTTRVSAPAPVEDRSTGRTGAAPSPAPAGSPAAAPAPAVAAAPAAPPKPPPGIENAGKPGYYTIKPGDTLIRVGLETGQSWRDIARWSDLTDPNKIEVGQVVRVVAPGMAPGEAPVAVARPVTSGTVASAPVSAPVASATPSAPRPASAPAAAPGAVPAVASAPTAAPASEDGTQFVWPVAGAVIENFDEAKNNKGIDIAGKAGDPVVAAADGRVVYAGSSVRGLGNLIVIKHSELYLTAYAHNQALLVKEDQAVKRGQRIAEMGQSDADRVKLHFEIRRQGKPIDPIKLLPGR
jgi:lipoprotein NlpD